MFEPIASVSLEDIEIESQGSLRSVKVPIGFCQDSNRISFVASNMERCFDKNINAEAFHEMAFQIEVLSVDGTMESFSSQDRNECLNYVPQDMRIHVTPIVSGS